MPVNEVRAPRATGLELCLRMNLLMSKNDYNVQEWEDGLPAPEELISLTQSLISPGLASAFSISPEPASSAAEIQIASERKFAALRRQENHSSPLIRPTSVDDAHPTSSTQENQNLAGGIPFRPEAGGLPLSFSDSGYGFKELNFETGLWNQGTERASLYQHKSPAGYGDSVPGANGTAYGPLERRASNGFGIGVNGPESSDGGGSRLRKRSDVELEDADSGACLENSSEEPSARTLKRPRLVWTPQLHKKFVDAVAQLGIKNAVPKTIMQLMNVGGLTRENVASHLQKYRLYLKRIQGLSSEGPSVSDQLFASTPVPPSLAASAHFLSNHGEEVFPLLMSMSMAGVPHAHMVGPRGTVAPYSSFDQHIYNAALGRSPAQRLTPGDQDYTMENQGRPLSPQRRVLTLFPTSGP